MQRELTFYPETERTRDLIYSEYASCDRSIHVLLQDDSISQYRFLLSSYREIVSRYLSSSKLQPPVAFLNDLADRFEKLSHDANFTVEDFNKMGFFLLLRSAGDDYVLTSNPGQVHLHRGGEFVGIADTSLTGVDRMRFDAGDLQEELFPQRLKDCFAFFRLEPGRFEAHDIVMGCREEDKSTVIEALTDPLVLGNTRQRGVVTSKFIARKLLAVRLHGKSADPEVAGAAKRSRRRQSGRRRRRLVLVGGTAAFLIAAVWAATQFLPGKIGRTIVTNETVPVTEEPVAAVQSGSHATDMAGAPSMAADESSPPQFVPSWHKSFDDPVTSSPALHDNLVVFGCRDGNVYALDRQSGDAAWTSKNTHGIGASPAIHAGTVVVADYGGVVSALDAKSGAKRWTRALPMRVVSSPSILNDRVLVGCYDGYAYCLDLTDGRVLWKHRTGGRIRGSIAAFGEEFFVPSYDGYLYALSGATGEVKWRYQLKGNVTSSPAANKSIVVVGAADGSLHAVDTESGSLRWKHETGGPIKSSVAVRAGRVFVGSNDKHLYCLNAANGSLVWKYETGDIILARPHVRDGMVYVGSYDGFVYCVNIESGQLVDRFQSGGSIYSSPVADDTAVFFGNNNGTFVCLTYRSKKAS